MARPLRSAPTARALIMHFLSYVREAETERVVRYLALEYGIQPRTTRNTLSILAREGRIARGARGKYRYVKGGVDSDTPTGMRPDGP